MAEAYFEALLDYEMEYLEPAVAYVIRTSKWFPKPVELREAASAYRVEARRRALPERLQRALEGPRLTEDEIKAFLAVLRARPHEVEVLRDTGPLKSADALQAEAARLEAIDARAMTDAKRAALARFARYQATRDHG